MNVYSINPTAIPLAMDPENAVIAIMLSGAIVSSNVPKLIWLRLSKSIKPTIIRQGAVAIFGTVKIKGVKSSAPKKHNPVNIDVKPVRPPIETPDADST